MIFELWFAQWAGHEGAGLWCGCAVHVVWRRLGGGGCQRDWAERLKRRGMDNKESDMDGGG